MTNEKLDDKKSTISEHLRELRKRVMICVVSFFIAFGACYFFSKEIYAFLVHPLAETYGNTEGRRLIYTGLTEAFFTYLKIAFYAGVFVSFPIIATQIYIFLAPGLYKREKWVLFPFLIATPLLFIAGAALVYYVIFPLAWKFFVGFETAQSAGVLPIQLEARVSEYLSLVINLIIAFGIAFQMPVLLTLLAKVGFIEAKWLAEKRKYALIIILTMAAFLTPPDVISQIGLALPMMLLYECSIISCKLVETKKKQNA